MLVEARAPQLNLVEYVKERYVRLYGSSNTTPRMSRERSSGTEHSFTGGRDQLKRAPSLSLGGLLTRGSFAVPPPAAVGHKLGAIRESNTGEASDVATRTRSISNQQSVATEQEV